MILNKKEKKSFVVFWLLTSPAAGSISKHNSTELSRIEISFPLSSNNVNSTIGERTRETSVSFDIIASDIISKPDDVIIPLVIPTEPILFSLEMISTSSSLLLRK